MKENVMRSLTREEMKATFGGETWVAMAWKWLKKHVFAKTSGDPNCRIEGGVSVNI
jgi:hypothetical protein